MCDGGYILGAMAIGSVVVLVWYFFFWVLGIGLKPPEVTVIRLYDITLDEIADECNHANIEIYYDN